MPSVSVCFCVCLADRQHHGSTPASFKLRCFQRQLGAKSRRSSSSSVSSSLSLAGPRLTWPDNVTAASRQYDDQLHLVSTGGASVQVAPPTIVRTQAQLCLAGSRSSIAPASLVGGDHSNSRHARRPIPRATFAQLAPVPMQSQQTFCPNSVLIVATLRQCPLARTTQPDANKPLRSSTKQLADLLVVVVAKFANALFA